MSRVMKKRSHKFSGFTLMEVIIAMVLATMVMGIAMAVVNLVSKSYLGTNMETTIVREDTDFVFTVNDDIKNASTAFTMPRASFRLNNLTANWNYIGLIDGMTIPKNVSRTGKEIASARALVHATYVGKSEPAAVPVGSIKQKSNDGQGWFVIRILGHDFVDVNDLTHEYDLVFEPAKAGENNPEIRYRFTSTVKDKNGNPVGERDDGISTDIATMLTSLNSQQIVYRGGPSNPATALAYSNDVIATSTSVKGNPNNATLVTMVLDYSASMYNSFGGGNYTRRIDSLKQSVETLLNNLSDKGNVSVLIVPFSWTGMNYAGQYIGTPYNPEKDHTFNLSNPEELERARGLMRSIKPSGNTATGDGIRRALGYMNEFNTSQPAGTKIKNMLVVLTDGETNVLAYDSNGKPMSSPNGLPNYIANHFDGVQYLRINEWGEIGWPSGRSPKFEKMTPQEFIKLWAGKMKTKYPDLDTYLISVSASVPEADKKVLQEAFGTDKQFDANDAAALVATFDEITDSIGDNIERFQGPSL